MKLFKRRNYLIDKDLQYRLLIVYIYCLTIFFAIIALALFTPLLIKLDRNDLAFYEIVRVADQILYLHDNFWPIALILLIALALYFLFISHKIAGPLYRFNFLFKAIKSGNLPKPICLRKGDYVHKEMEAINEMIKVLRLKIMEIQQGQALLSEIISKLEEVSSSASKDEILERIKTLGMVNRQFGEKLDYFKYHLFGA